MAHFKMSKSHLSSNLILAFVAACASASVVAAPASAIGEEGNNVSATAVSPDGRTGQAGVSGDSQTLTSGHRTIDRLLNTPTTDTSNDAAGKPAKQLVEGTLPAKATNPSAPASSAMGPFSDLREVLLGNRDAKAKQTSAAQNPELALARRREVERLSNNSGSAAHESSSAGAPAEATGVAVTVARYIRENRLLVMGIGVMVLAMVWGTASFASHRRR